MLQGIVKKDIDGCRQLRDLVFAVIGAVMGREAQDSAGNFEGTQCSGAGVSVGAGLPTWNALLQQLAAKVGVTSEEQVAYFNALDFLSKAQVV